MADVDQQTTREPGERPPPPEPAETTPERRTLDRPPGERYRSTDSDAETVQASAHAPARGLVFATLAGIAGAALAIVLGGVFAVSSGLVIVAAVIGRTVALGLRVGAGRTVSPATARTAATIIALGAVLLAQVGIWLYARSEGGVLDLVDYLGQTFGLLVPLEFVLAGLIAWLSA
jgi:hypothetical protein